MERAVRNKPNQLLRRLKVRKYQKINCVVFMLPKNLQKFIFSLFIITKGFFILVFRQYFKQWKERKIPMDTFIGELHSPYVHPMYIFTYITHVVVLQTWVFHSDQGQTLIESHKSRNNLDDAVTFSVKLAYFRKVFFSSND